MTRIVVSQGLHPMPPPRDYETLVGVLDESRALLVQRVAEGAERMRQELFRVDVKRAYLSALLGREPATAHATFVEAVGSGLGWLTAHQEGRSATPISVLEYRLVMLLAAAAGTPEQIRTVVWGPEPYVIQQDGRDKPAADALAVWRLWFRTQRGSALPKAFTAVEEAIARMAFAPVALLQYEDGAAMTALQAIASGDAARFTRALRDVVRFYRKPFVVFLKSDPTGATCLTGLVLARAAREAGWIVEPGPYLPTHVLPEARA
jgi:hypothetical protein